ncbi:hypothetical protein F2Q70_00001062 [Brassica cretica]|uniref:Pentatricopeptide repeat-containing protein n=1 Tax=Brassica cretica TaxID=69181 RepID=A0A8S9IPK8_BRACR|nr:hypothetical protein F2Q70_00001062 [Brassica cretica]
MYDQAHELLQSIRDHELNLDLVTYNSLMDIYVRRGECWKAEEILNSVDKSKLGPGLVQHGDHRLLQERDDARSG